MFVELYFTLSTILWAFCGTNRRFQFQKSGQPFIRTHNETLSVAAVCVCNPDRSPFGINRRRTRWRDLQAQFTPIRSRSKT
jgi:hypothetical protein